MNKKSIIRKVELAVVIPLFLQACLFVFTILDNGAMSDLRKNALNDFLERGNNKHTYFEEHLLQNWSHISREAEDINKYILDILESKDASTDVLNSNECLANEVLSRISKNIMYIARENYVTDVFLVLDTIEPEQGTSELREKVGLYIKDAVPIESAKDNSDLYMERGPVELAHHLKIKTNSNWQKKYLLNKEESDSEFFYKPINESKKYKNIDSKTLGYWGKPSIITNPDLPVMTYSIPLINSEGRAYGILGVGIDLNYINNMFKEDALVDAYAIIVEDSKIAEESLALKDIINIDNTNEKLVKDYENKTIKIEKTLSHIYKIVSEENTKDANYIYRKELKLYNSNDVLEDEKWELILFTRENKLFKKINEIENDLKISALISTAIGLLIALILARKVTKPLRNLVEKVKQSNPREPIKLEKVNISEIDELSLAITTLSRNVADESSKLNEIIRLLNIPFGAFKLRKGEKVVYCTSRLFHILEVEGLHETAKYIDLDDFNTILEEATKNKYENEENVYIIKKDYHEDRWIRLIIQQDEIGVFGVITDVTQEILEKNKIEYDRDHDVLTGLLNRRAFRRMCMDKMKKDYRGIAAFIMLDLDNLKFVNDTYGHEYGDEYIKEAARIIKAFEKHQALVARISGDEFLVYLYGYENKSQILNIVRKIHGIMKNTIFTLPYDDYYKIKIRASIGISWYPENSDDYDTLIKYADFAMYKIKNTVKGSMAEFNKEEYSEKSFLINNKEDLSRLIDEELIYYVFHPIVDGHTGEIYAYEMLMRSKLASLKSPYQILAIAASESRLYEIERMTWFKVLETVEKYDKELGDAKIFINSLPNYLLSEEDLEKLIAQYEKYFGRVVVELLENEQLDSEFMLKKRKQIERCKAKIAIDDFGSGYNNEAILLEVPTDFIKVDMEIVREIHKDLDRQDIIKNLISYASKRGIKVIAEGIETKEELKKLIELGVDYVQGYYMSKAEMNPPKISEGVVQEILDINKNMT